MLLHRHAKIDAFGRLGFVKDNPYHDNYKYDYVYHRDGDLPSYFGYGYIAWMKNGLEHRLGNFAIIYQERKYNMRFEFGQEVFSST